MHRHRCTELCSAMPLPHVIMFASRTPSRLFSALCTLRHGWSQHGQGMVCLVTTYDLEVNNGKSFELSVM